MKARTLPVIVNSSSGKGCRPEDIEALEKTFRDAGAEATIYPARDGAEMLSIAKRVVDEGHPVVVAGGGDGTVSAVASMVAGSQSALGVLPLGTLNHFAKDLGISLTPDEAAQVIVANHQVEVDIGEVNGRTFINNSSLGLYPTMVVIREKRRRELGWSKWRALVGATLTVLRRHAMLHVRLCHDGGNFERRTPLVFVGNNEYKREGFEAGSRERLDGGLLSIYLTRRHGRRGLLTLAMRALFGRLEPAVDFEQLNAGSVTIATKHRRPLVATDGEVTVMDAPLEYRIRPRALRVIVPAPQLSA